LRSIFRSLGKTANLAGGVVRTHWNGLAHGKPPQFAILNHAAIDSGIPRESATQRLGIRRRFANDRRVNPRVSGGALLFAAPESVHGSERGLPLCLLICRFAAGLG